MRLKLISTKGIDPQSNLVEGEFYEPVFYSKEYITINGYFVSRNNFESLFDLAARLISISEKFILSRPGKGYTVDLLITDKNYFVVYSHSKGNHWNIWGNHYKYVHDLETGKYLGDFSNIGNTILKERLLLDGYNKLSKLIKVN